MNDDLVDWVREKAPDLMDDWQRLRRLASVLDDYYRQRWQRRVPMSDALIDRWERAKSLGFGDEASVYDSALIIGDVQVGCGTWVGPNTVLDGSGGLRIGDYCSISTGVQVYSHVSVQWALSGGAVPPQRRETRIGSNTYIGPNAVIPMGITIGSNCVVGAGSLVLEDIPDNSFAYGTPARVVSDTHAYLARKGQEQAA